MKYMPHKISKNLVIYIVTTILKWKNMMLMGTNYLAQSQGEKIKKN